MQLTRFTDIGLRVVMRLVTAPADTTLTSRDLAAELAVPYTHVAKVVSRLSELGVIHSRRGRSGGIAVTELGRTAQVGWLASKLEGDGEVVDCDGPQPCPLRGNCKLRGALAQAQRAFYDSLDAHTIDELASSSARITLLSIGTPTRTTASGTEDAAGIR
ncbi:Rrf2 family transcriptional regulator [Gordonia sp. (in: high G+C Gram-positive bacteria)]|jgi:Rrf2 family nitric oxide-sensitive transcriptional repressor|uniref:RrF2 family transcriptional regulator n=1 Tax=Gordonia sp. (in: high G+C Gram-positive bacteria) TaxID=84139 RepID=UPI001D550C2D|nr:Rrf2 family transcriptional regulator [Gordonia sp. (in: high G+C Gram-positive bacteria)]MCB1297220.1 Rrf2 family transcriptional regulator [Gordonia sp. (in: high G+C Gram-positive bacteria)]HMS73778.1 Rrf2 family transcriptional regulator [Gordonia sp. (in: high G+C Gram-positive bacteria)]HQV16937.1 Rrf2 family transcriptional regulator [Gordonia sp. (in: high G+C Gram-positive bacteria)]